MLNIIVKSAIDLDYWDITQKKKAIIRSPFIIILCEERVVIYNRLAPAL